jgi:hypothetical protein
MKEVRYTHPTLMCKGILDALVELDGTIAVTIAVAVAVVDDPPPHYSHGICAKISKYSGSVGLCCWYLHLVPGSVNKLQARDTVHDLLLLLHYEVMSYWFVCLLLCLLICA